VIAGEMNKGPSQNEIKEEREATDCKVQVTK
jgi:hypothetical protein